MGDYIELSCSSVQLPPSSTDKQEDILTEMRELVSLQQVVVLIEPLAFSSTLGPQTAIVDGRRQNGRLGADVGRIAFSGLRVFSRPRFRHVAQPIRRQETGPGQRDGHNETERCQDVHHAHQHGVAFDHCDDGTSTTTAMMTKSAATRDSVKTCEYTTSICSNQLAVRWLTLLMSVSLYESWVTLSWSTGKQVGGQQPGWLAGHQTITNWDMITWYTRLSHH